MNPKPAGEKLETKAPPDLRKALAADPKIMALWKDLTPISRRDFISWITSAKQPETRRRRIRIACDKLLSGKRRPCCYAVVPMNLYKALGTNSKAKRTWSDLTPDARRDFSDWIESAKDSEAHKLRVEKACMMLAAGKKRP